MTFKAMFADSFDLCIDSCFWPPSSRLAFSNSAAETYIPMIWDDYLGQEEYCFRPFIIPNIPPEFTTCPGGAGTHFTNETDVQLAFEAYDEDGVVTGVTATPNGTGFGNVSVTYTVAPPAQTVEGYVSYDVTNHCLDGGYIELICTDDADATNLMWPTPKVCEPPVVLGNHAPTVTCPATATFKYCDGFADVAVGSDDDDDAISYDISGVVGIAIDGSGNITWDTDCDDVGGPYTITVTVTDVCQATGQCTFDLTVTNATPTLECPEDGSVLAGGTFESTDFVPDDDCPGATVAFKSITPAPVASPDPTIVDSHVEWATNANENDVVYTICLEITDECNETFECCFDVEVKKQAMVNIATADPCANPGDLVMLPIEVVSGFIDAIGGFELHIDFDYTSMTFVQARKGELIDGTQFGDFEEFTYRLLPCPSCGCCKYKILLFGMYDLPNTVMGTPIPAGSTGELVELYFVINSDENLRGFTIPVCWQWTPCDYDPDPPIDPDCGENTFSDETGNILYVSGLPCQFDLDCCDDPVPELKPVTFQGDPLTGEANCSEICGGIPICDEGEVDCKRGDINLNTITYEVADAVLFAAYHVEGVDVFHTDPDERAAQICATDVNADGRPLTLSDLVYLIRVILQDAVALPKLGSPSSEVATMVVSDGTIAAECASPIGAILFEFDGAVGASLLASNMEMMTNDNKVLVWSRNGNSIENAEVLSFSGAELTSVTAVDRDSRELGTAITVRMTPTAFALHAAYPNPFNPFVNLSFSMPEAASYSLSIYNVAGQLVRSYEGMGTAGLNVVTWDGKDNAGNEVSSGVYFYKLMAAGNSATAKMVMMK